MNYYKFARMVVDYSRTWLLRPIPNRKVFVTWNISRVNRSVEAAVFSSCQNKHTNKQTYKQRNKQSKQTNKQTSKQAKQTNLPTLTPTLHAFHIYIICSYFELYKCYFILNKPHECFLFPLKCLPQLQVNRPLLCCGRLKKPKELEVEVQ